MKEIETWKQLGLIRLVVNGPIEPDPLGPGYKFETLQKETFVTGLVSNNGLESYLDELTDPFFIDPLISNSISELGIYEIYAHVWHFPQTYRGKGKEGDEHDDQIDLRDIQIRTLNEGESKWYTDKD